MDAILPSSSPNSSPLGNRGPKFPMRWTLHKPSHSSPLSPTAVSATEKEITPKRRKAQFKSQVRGRVASGSGVGTDESPQQRFLRDRFKQQCLERAKENRAKAVRKGRGNSSESGLSSDGMDGEDAVMEDENEYMNPDLLDDELYKRVMLNEIRKSQHASRVSFEYEVGSSIDPGMYDDMSQLEMDITGQVSKYRDPSPPPDIDDDELIKEYLSELEEPELKQVQERVVTGIVNTNNEDPGELEREFTSGSILNNPCSSPSHPFYTDSLMTSPPSSPSRYATNEQLQLVQNSDSESDLSNLNSNSSWNCPLCNTATLPPRISCENCTKQFGTEDAQRVWFDAEGHPGGQDFRQHKPLAAQMPNESGMGIVMLCSAPECDWCFAL